MPELLAVGLLGGIEGSAGKFGSFEKSITSAVSDVMTEEAGFSTFF
jgi:hypothetical protein